MFCWQASLVFYHATVMKIGRSRKMPRGETVDTAATIGAGYCGNQAGKRRRPSIIPRNYRPWLCHRLLPNKDDQQCAVNCERNDQKEEFATAYAKFAQKIQGQNPDVQKEKINRDIKGDSIDIFEKMGVTLEFDPDDFKQISKDENQTKDFTNKTSLEWDWIIKPLHSTPKSIINFKFYYLDPDNKQNFILEKTISVSSSVDARSFTDKWADFLAEDPRPL